MEVALTGTWSGDPAALKQVRFQVRTMERKVAHVFASADSDASVSACVHDSEVESNELAEARTVMISQRLCIPKGFEDGIGLHDACVQAVAVRALG